MSFEWDEEKNRTNRRKHDVSFETAVLVFDDPYALTKRDLAHEEEERFITLGAIGSGSILFVVHTNYQDRAKAEVIRDHFRSRSNRAREEEL